MHSGWRINCQFRISSVNLFLKRSCQNGNLFISFMKHICRALLFLIAFHGGVRGLYSQTPMPREMNLIVVEGEGQSMNIGERAPKPPLVRMEDENHQPIVGAAVTFTLPTEGATGDFGGGSKTLTVVTDDQGKRPRKALRSIRCPASCRFTSMLPTEDSRQSDHYRIRHCASWREDRRRWPWQWQDHRDPGDCRRGGGRRRILCHAQWRQQHDRPSACAAACANWDYSGNRYDRRCSLNAALCPR